MPTKRKAREHASVALRQSYRGVAADQRVADRRRQFLAAGFELFGTRGVADVRVKELCAAAGLTDRYFYESFKNIEDLFDVVLTDLATQGNQVFETAMRDALAVHPTDIRAWLRAGISSTFRFLAADPRRVRIAIVETIAVKGHGDGRRCSTRSVKTISFGGSRASPTQDRCVPTRPV